MNSNCKCYKHYEGEEHGTINIIERLDLVRVVVEEVMLEQRYT